MVQTLVHHSNLPYEVAAEKASLQAKTKLGALIEGGQGKIQNLIQKLQEETPSDYIVKSSGVEFFHKNGLKVKAGDQVFDVHPHARNLFTELIRGVIPLSRQAISKMLDAGEWGLDLLTHNLNKIWPHINKERLMFRAVKKGETQEVRGVVSDSYQRWGSRELLEAFAKSCEETGAVPVETHFTDTRWAIKTLIPKIYEPIKNEVLCYGVSIYHSDFRDGPLSLKCFLLRLWCTNYAIREEALRRIHLGKRLPDNIALSEQTYQLDTQAMSSAIGDIVKELYLPEHVDQEMNFIKTAAETEIDAKSFMQALQKKSLLGKDEGEKFAEVYNTPDVELLPPGNNLWRFSNALSLFAHQTEDVTRRLQLEELAGEVIQTQKSSPQISI